MSKKTTYQELSSLFFEVRGLIRERIPGHSRDQNTWLRLETLRFIESHEGPTMRNLARYMHIAAPSASSLIGGLSRSGFVRRGGASDKRTITLFLTLRGKRELKRCASTSARALQQVFSKLPPQQLTALIRTLRLLTEMHRKE